MVGEYRKKDTGQAPRFFAPYSHSAFAEMQSGTYCLLVAGWPAEVERQMWLADVWEYVTDVRTGLL